MTWLVNSHPSSFLQPIFRTWSSHSSLSFSSSDFSKSTSQKQNSLPQYQQLPLCFPSAQRGWLLSRMDTVELWIPHSVAQGEIPNAFLLYDSLVSPSHWTIFPLHQAQNLCYKPDVCFLILNVFIWQPLDQRWHMVKQLIHFIEHPDLFLT